jgi:hypothetical protein
VHYEILIEVTQRAAGTFAKKLLGEDKVKAVLKRVDGFTRDELWAGMAQTISMVHSLGKGIQGIQSFLDWSLACC